MLSVPRTKTSMYPADRDTAAGDEASFPLRDCQPDHDEPVHVFWYRTPSVPCTKTSRRPVPHEQAAGPVPDATSPPRPRQLDQELPEYSLYHRALSVPRTKTSILPFACEVTPGEEVSPAPRDFHPDQVVPSQCV